MKNEIEFRGDLEGAQFVATDGYLVMWSMLMWALGAATAYVAVLF
jgi:hypothetical protein